MKNKNALTILLYVFAVLSLAYTCYAAIQAYNTFTSYYSTNLSVVNLVLYMITTCYESICFSVLFYALGVFSEMFKKKEEEKQFYTVSFFQEMIMKKDFKEVCDEMDVLGKEIGVTIHCQREEIFEKMHRL